MAGPAGRQSAGGGTLSDTPYDRVPYRGDAHPGTHPDRLATLARLHGMSPAPVSGCRVLEIGCGAGRNLVPMAHGLPGSSFLGIDPAGEPLERGRDAARHLGLDNVELRRQGVEDLPPDAGPFDYIVAHGVYSWVPPAVRTALLEVCRRRLAPQGVAFVSYGTYPGRYEHRRIWEMLRFHVRGVEDPEERCRQARGFLDFLRRAQPRDSAYRAFLDRAAERISRYPDWFLLHDDLSEHNEPLYFHELVSRAGEHGLQFLSEAAFASGSPVDFPPAVGSVLEQLGDVRLKEQYLDFLRNRTFRETLLCSADVSLSRPPPASAFTSLLAAAPAPCRSGDPDPASEAAAVFEGLSGQEMEVADPVARAVLLALGERWPACASFPELEEIAAARLERRSGEGAEERRELLARVLLELYRRRMIDLHAHHPPVTPGPGPRPEASPVARLQLERSPDTGTVTNLRHRDVPVGEADERALLPLLDGTRDRQRLAEALASGAEGDEESSPESDPAGVERVETVLDALASRALLMDRAAAG